MEIIYEIKWHEHVSTTEKRVKVSGKLKPSEQQYSAARDYICIDYV